MAVKERERMENYAVGFLVREMAFNGGILIDEVDKGGGEGC